MIRKLGAFGLVAGLAFAALPAQAASFIKFDTGVGTVPSYFGTPVTFQQTFGNAVTNNNFQQFANVSNSVATQTASGAVRVYQNSVSGNSARPTNATGNFLSILNNGSYKITFNQGGVSALAFVLGTLDSYNQIKLTFQSGSVLSNQTLNGGEIIGLAANAGANSEGRVTYDFGSGSKLAAIEFLSSGNSFEIDTIAAAAPEPATWLMMILGFGMVGGALRRRRKGAFAVA